MPKNSHMINQKTNRNLYNTVCKIASIKVLLLLQSLKLFQYPRFATIKTAFGY